MRKISPFPDATFDRVLANFALLHLPDPERACADAFRVLKPGGKFGFTRLGAARGKSIREDDRRRHPGAR